MSYSFSFPGFLGLRFYSPQFRFSATENLEWPWRFVGNSFASFNSTSILLLTITQINYSMRIYKGCVVGVNSPSYAVRNEDSRYETFSTPEPTILLACGRNREALGATISGAIDEDFVKPDGQNSVISFVISKWLLPELSIPAAGQKDRRLWGQECESSQYKCRE